MCYMTVLSTTSDEDLALANGSGVNFSRELPGVPEERYLRFRNRWYLGSESGCSCEFRHLGVGSIELGFGLPEAWYPEDVSSVRATSAVMAIVRRLVEGGHSVDCVDSWSHGQSEPDALAGDLPVNLADVSDEAFRFFERHRFTFARGD